MNRRENFKVIDITNLKTIQEEINQDISDKNLRIILGGQINNQTLNANLDFLIELGWFKYQNEKITRIKTFKKQKFTLDIIKSLKNSQSEYSIFYKEFIDKFIEENEYIFKANIYEVNEYGYLSNFLESHIGMIQKNDYTYRIKKDFIEYVLRPKKTLKKFKEEQEKKEESGSGAEKEIIKYETKRVKRLIGEKYNIQHISINDVGSGYDIQSWDIIDKNIVKIYIEVKAIKNCNKRKFYWSENEMNVAKKLKDKYYLYLLPHNGPEKYYTDKLIIIRNPYSSVYENVNGWSGQRSGDMFFEEIEKS